MNPDHNIDRVLGALRHAVPPTGMERRILNMLEIEARRPALAIRPGRIVWMTTAACCCGALIVAVLIGMFVMRRHPAPAVSTVRIQPAQASNTSRPSVAIVPEMTEAAPILHPHSGAVQHSAQSRRNEVAQSEETLISHPAPPIPLTEQERILLRFARHGRTDDLAQISNERKAAKEEQDATEFQAFFEPPPIKIGESE
jgi:hypothetical protein